MPISHDTDLISLDRYPEVRLLDHMVIFNFLRNRHLVFYNVSLELNQSPWLWVHSLNVWFAFSL